MSIKRKIFLENEIDAEQFEHEINELDADLEYDVLSW